MMKKQLNTQKKCGLNNGSGRYFFYDVFYVLRNGGCKGKGDEGAAPGQG